MIIEECCSNEQKIFFHKVWSIVTINYTKVFENILLTLKDKNNVIILKLSAKKKSNLKQQSNISHQQKNWAEKKKETKDNDKTGDCLIFSLKIEVREDKMMKNWFYKDHHEYTWAIATSSLCIKLWKNLNFEQKILDETHWFYSFFSPLSAVY